MKVIGKLVALVIGLTAVPGAFAQIPRFGNPFDGSLDPMNGNSIFRKPQKVDNRTPVIHEVTFFNESFRETYGVALVRFGGGSESGDGTTGGFADSWEIAGWYLVKP